MIGCCVGESKIRLAVAQPAFNEGSTLPEVIKRIRKCVSGVTDTLILVVENASEDKTLEVAK